MRTRAPAVAGSFYPARAEECRDQIRELLAGLPRDPCRHRCLGGIAPHAGWIYSGATALRTLTSLAASDPVPRRLVVLGAVHRSGVPCASLGSWDAWATPLGECPVDLDFAQRLGAAGAAVVADGPHAQEHSIEVLLPFVRHLLPDCAVVPIAVPPRSGASAFGTALAALIAPDPTPTAFLASSDLTHYGLERYGFAPAGEGRPALVWARANDQRILDLVRELRAEEIVPEARAHQNACGAGALAAAASCARSLGAGAGTVLERTTSHAAEPHREASSFVGYAAAVFVAAG